MFRNVIDGLGLAFALMAGAVIALGAFGALVAGDWSSPVLWLALWLVFGVGGYVAWPWLQLMLHRPRSGIDAARHVAGAAGGTRPPGPTSDEAMAENFATSSASTLAPAALAAPTGGRSKLTI